MSANALANANAPRTIRIESMINRLGFVPVPAKILVVDDHESVRDLLKLLLEGEGYEVVEASDGAQALNYIDKEHPDLLILDLMMPEVDGEQVIKAMWRNQESVKTPVVVVSAKYEALDSLTELIGGVNVFPKPFEPTKLLDRVREICG